MEKLNTTTENILIERFGKDSIIALATADGNKPFVRNVDAFYEDGAFYVLTYAISGKINQIQKNPDVAISGDWFTASGKGINLGFFGKKENEHHLPGGQRFRSAVCGCSRACRKPCFRYNRHLPGEENHHLDLQHRNRTV